MALLSRIDFRGRALTLPGEGRNRLMVHPRTSPSGLMARLFFSTASAQLGDTAQPVALAASHAAHAVEVDPYAERFEFRLRFLATLLGIDLDHTCAYPDAARVLP